MDQDQDAIAYISELFANDARVRIVHANVAQLRPILQQLNMPSVDGVLLDLGISSHQIDAASRGFSHRYDALIDMRMNRETTMNAADYLATLSRDELTRIFSTYGEEPRSARIAEAIVRIRRTEPIERTHQLARIVADCVPVPHYVKSVSRVFQALRILVNDEMRMLSEALPVILESLRDDGRVVVISYHSLEDRIVKQFFHHESLACICPPRTPLCRCGKVKRLDLLTRKAVRPSLSEIQSNSRARSAKLRAAKKIA